MVLCGQAAARTLFQMSQKYIFGQDRVTVQYGMGISDREK